MLQSDEETKYLKCLQKIPRTLRLTEKWLSHVRKPAEYTTLWSKISKLYNRGK